MLIKEANRRQSYQMMLAKGPLHDLNPLAEKDSRTAIVLDHVEEGLFVRIPAGSILLWHFHPSPRSSSVPSSETRARVDTSDVQDFSYML